MVEHIPLSRSLSLPMLVLYGLGTTIGAGIYALIGEVAAVAGYLAPFSFLVASLMAAVTAMSFAELSARLPRAAGEALYVREGLSSRALSTSIGLLVAFAGLVSAAAMVNGFVGYLHQFVAADRVVAIVLITLAMGAVAAWGIAESVSIASLITVVEIGGLLLVIAVSPGSLPDDPFNGVQLLPALDGERWGYVFSGAILAFYAFIGFEDMVNVAEEVKRVRRNLPLAILLTLGITTLLYLLLMTVAVLSVPPAELAASEAPLAYLYQQYTGGNAYIISVIGMFAILNGALIQVVMATRVVYGLSAMGQLPAALCSVHPRTRTPLFATALVTAVILTLAISGGLASLAKLTSTTMLIVFSIVNLALWRIKRRDPRPQGVRVFPAWVPMSGFLVSIAFVLRELVGLLGR
jgi:amino acid transporter